MKQNENKSLVALLGIIAFLLLGVVYYYVIMPKSEAETQKTNSINQLIAQNSALENQVAVLSVVSTDDANDFGLRKKLPMNRDLDKLLHSIHEVELMSESKIIEIVFNNYDEEVSGSAIVLPTEEEKEAAELETETTVSEETNTEKEAESEADAEEDSEVDEAKPVTPINIELLPDELKLITLSVELSVLDYDHLLTFLQEVEDLERVVRIDAVEFKQPGEFELAQENPDERIPVIVQLTTFYSEEAGS
ncbi:hypothetical protein [Sporosarcina sp. G11-34]|uniref:hypothetical protein n=1 Tax=Sporosarcina sp. G11-34 TaxID=2849605 RepID=UPI0022A91D81|nr:hypothetical protein [Sporosarcina sp. G11-34]MCZ2259825.1 hypothetical protein [Sporosarcina sp. G11-34]